MNKVWIKEKDFLTIINDIQQHSPLETGGMLLGYHTQENDLVITHLVSAGENCKRTKYSFSYDIEHSTQIIADVFEETNGDSYFIGDWHSHPRSIAALSYRDKKALVRTANHTPSQCPDPIMIIFGSKPEEWSINCVRHTASLLSKYLPFTLKTEQLQFKVYN